MLEVDTQRLRPSQALKPFGEIMKRNITDIQNRTERLRRALMKAGACLVGFTDLSCLDTNVTKGYSFGIGFALEYDLDAVDSFPIASYFRQ